MMVLVHSFITLSAQAADTNSPPSASSGPPAGAATTPAEVKPKLTTGPATAANCTQTSAKDAAEYEETCTIAVGVIDVRTFDFLPRVQVAKDDLLQVKEGGSPNEIRMFPLKKGTASVFIEDHQGGHRQRVIYNITVNDLSGRVQTIRQLLSDVEGITVRALDDKIILDGELIVPRDFDRIVAVQQAFSDSVLNLVTLSRISREAMAHRMQKEINDSVGGANVTVRIMNDTFFLNGKVDSKADFDRVETLATTYLPENMGSVAIKEGYLSQGIQKRFAIRNMLEIEQEAPPPLPKMVRITYHFVEISKNYLKSSFFKWTPMLSQNAGINIGQSTTGGVAASGSGSFSGTISSLFPKLQSGSQGGFARVLDSAVEIGLDGVKIGLQRKDKVPYISAIVNGVPMPAEADAGLNIEVTPTIKGEDRVQLDSKFTFSAFEGGGAGGAPAVTSTYLQNTILIKSGDSAVLGGLISNDIAKNVGQDPTAAAGGGAAPAGGAAGGAAPAGGAAAPAAGGGDPIFNLLRSKQFQNDKTQFVVFLTPKIIDDASEGTADIKAKIINNTKKRQRTIQ